MADHEIDSFIQKFKLLRGAGIEASLNFETKLGEVFISLNCKVGRNLPPPSPSVTSAKRSPSYYRRQARCKAERENRSEVIKLRSSLPLADETKEEVIDESEISDGDVIEDALATRDRNVTGAEIMEEDEVEDTNHEAEKVFEEESNDDVCEQLESMIKESKKNRHFWDKFHSLPP